MSRDLARKKRVQAGLSYLGAGLGLSALAAKGGGTGSRALLRRVPQTAAKLRLRPHIPELLDRTSLGLVTTGAGVGGVSGINFARLQQAEAKKEDPRVIKSAFGVVEKYDEVPDSHRRDFIKREKERPYLGGQADAKNYSQLGRVVPQQPLKAAAPPAVPRHTRPGGIDEEDRRQRRMKSEQYGLAGAAVPTAVAGGTMAVRSARNAPAKRKLIAQGAAALDRSGQYDSLINPHYARWSNRKGLATKATNTADHLEAGNPTPSRRVAGNIASQRAAAERWTRQGNVSANANRHATASAAKWKASATTAAEQAGKLKVRPKAAAATLGTAAVLGGGALAVRQMRKKQGKQYSDWWDD